MKALKHLHRILYINYILIKHGLLNRHRPQAVRLREALEELGPIFIKFGQILSTRADLLPEDMITELSKLQDQVPPFCGKQARHIVESALGANIQELYSDFEIIPLASASIAQVHAATMLDGTQVVVKILRPHIKKHVARDIELLLLFAKIFGKYWKIARHLKPYEVVLEIQKSLYDELDLLRDAANASQLRRNFNNSHLLYVPAVYWSHTRHNVLTLERIEGIPISDIQALKNNGTDLKRLSERGVEIFFTQVFRDCFFHADMHPGNVWVSKEHPEDPQYLALDFGIIGTLSPQDQYYLAENFLAFFQRNYRRVAELHIQSGWVPRNTRIDEFEAAIRCVCEPIFERPLKDISFGKTLLRLFQTARRFDMHVQPQLILLQKTLVNVEGLGRQLYPELDLWQTAKPFLETWMQNRIGGNSLIQRIRTHAPYLLEKLPELPSLVYQALQQNTANPVAVAPTGSIAMGASIYLIIAAMSASIAAALTFALLYFLK